MLLIINLAAIAVNVTVRLKLACMRACRIPITDEQQSGAMVAMMVQAAISILSITMVAIRLLTH